MENHSSTIQGWFNFQSVYNEAIEKASDGAIFVEVGSWKGKSAAYMAEAIKNSEKKITFICVDTWEGSEEHINDPDILNGSLFETFTKNMSPLDEYYKPLRMKSIDAAKTFKNKSLDFVFIDAAHDYDSVIADIKAWKPKIKKNGILAGHDIDHPPVRQAVRELLPEYIVNHASWIYYM